MKLVLVGNRVVAHGDCFIQNGDTVCCMKTGKIYNNATTAECTDCPADIDSVGYEYHNGVFVPCAPFGVGSGNIAVIGECGTILDSGIELNGLSSGVALTYTGTGSSGSFTVPFTPKAFLIVNSNYTISAVVINSVGTVTYKNDDYASIASFTVSRAYVDAGVSVTITQTKLVASGVTYTVYAMG